MSETGKSVIPKGMMITGDITVEGDLELEGDVIGNIVADNLDISGAVKGSIDVSQKLDIKRGALVTGKVTTKDMNVAMGAVCDIDMEKTHADRSPAQFFVDYMSKHVPAVDDL